MRRKYTTIFLKSEVTNITLHNLTSGSYNVTVYYPGDSKYAPSNATTTFKVLRDSCNLTVNITYNDDLTGIINVNNPNTFLLEKSELILIMNSIN